MNRAPFTSKVADDLEAGLPTGVELGRGRPPRRGELPFVVLYAIEGGGWTGPPVSQEADAIFAYRTKVVARREEDETINGTVELGSNALADTVRMLMLSAGNGVTGITVMGRYSVSPGGNQTDDKVINADEVFYYHVTSS